MRQAISQRSKKNQDKKAADYMAVQMKYSAPKINVMSRDRLEELFKFEKPYIIHFEYRKKEFQQYKPALNALIADNKVKLISKDAKVRIYEFIG